MGPFYLRFYVYGMEGREGEGRCTGPFLYDRSTAPKPRSMRAAAVGATFTPPDE
jgi:hypothetical protein